MIYYKLLKPEEAVNTERYQQQLTDLKRSLLLKRPECRNRQRKVIFLVTVLHHIRQNRFSTRWKYSAGKFNPLRLTPYLPDLAPSNYHFFASMCHPLVEQQFGPYEDVKKWLDKWFAAKFEDFTVVVFKKCPKD